MMHRYQQLNISKCLVILLLIIISFQSGSRWWESEGDHALAPLIGTEASCRSLFTISGVPGVNTLATDKVLRYPERNETDKWGRPTPQRGAGRPGVVGRVQHLQQKRSSPFGPSTDDYRQLARFLPTLLSLQDNNSTEDKHRKGQQTPVLSESSRISASGGVLPYVPCTIALFEDPAAVTACFRERLAKSDSLWIFFLGDSKIRNLFYEFLHRSDNEYHYMVKLQNGTKPFAELRKTPAKVHFDMVAMTKAAPRLRITFRFKKFQETEPSKIKSSSEVRQLRRWAEGGEAPPHLLVLGYTAWMMQKMEHQYPHDLLADLMEVHRLVVPLLHQLSQKTRVLVLPQSRYRTHAYKGLRAAMVVADSDAVNDWSEMMFLHYHLLYTEGHHPPGAPAAASAVPVPGVTSREEAAAAPNRGSPPAHAILPDRLVPAGTSHGLWWWDTSLPLNLAAIGECEELYRRGLTYHAVYSGQHLLCLDGQHAGQATLRDLVTMLLNLICNSVLQTDSQFCCH